MKTILRDIAAIQTGFFAKPVHKGEIVLLQSKHFDVNGQLEENLHPDLRAEGKIDKHILKKGDVLFAAKGTKNPSFLFDNEDVIAVASTSFFVIRLRDENVLPEYLTWFLNYPTTQTLIKSQARGSTIPSISKSVLEELEVPILPLSKQQLILEISKLRRREKGIQQEIEALRETQIQQLIINAIK